jgi:MGT family glycosyltransferase
LAHVLVVSYPATGHINPTLPVLTVLVSRGHRVSVVVPEQYRSTVEATGARVLTYPSMVPTDWSGVDIPRHPDADQLAQAQRDTVRETLTPLPSVVADLDANADGDVTGSERPDVVVYDVLGSAAGRLLSLAWDLPSVVTCPTFVGNETFSPYARAVAEGEAEAPDPAHPAMVEAGAILRSALDTWGLRDVSVGEFVAGSSERCRVVFLPRAFHPGEDTFDERFRFVGPCLRSGADDDGWSPPASGRPVVLVSLGTLGYDDSAALLRRVVEAVGRIGAHAVVSIGDVDPAVFGDDVRHSEHVELHRRVPQLAVLRHAAAFVSHAGMNSTMEALSLGVPLVDVAQTGEQRLVADQVQALDCGRALDPSSSVDVLAAALDEVRSSTSVAAAVSAMRQVIHSTGGAVAAADAVEAAVLSGETKPAR